MIGSISLTNGHCPSPGTEKDILITQGITTANDTKKATKLGMKVFRDKQCFNAQFAHMSSVFSPDRQASLMLLSLNNNCPSTAPFQSPIQVNSTSIERNVSIQEILDVTISLLNDCDFLLSNSKQLHVMISGGNFTNCSSIYISSKLQLPSRSYFKVLLTLTAILSGELLQTLLRIANFYEIFKADLVHLRSRHLCANCKLHA